MTAPVMGSCAPAKRPTQAPPTKKRAKIHGNAGRACSRSDSRQLALHVAMRAQDLKVRSNSKEIAFPRQVAPNCLPISGSAERSKDSAAIYDLAGHDSGHCRSAEGASVERRVARTAGRIGRMGRPCMIRRENRQVGGLISCNFPFDS